MFMICGRREDRMDWFELVILVNNCDSMSKFFLFNLSTIQYDSQTGVVCVPIGVCKPCKGGMQKKNVKIIFFLGGWKYKKVENHWFKLTFFFMLNPLDKQIFLWNPDTNYTNLCGSPLLSSSTIIKSSFFKFL
jgi:hypothetical protein